MQDLNEGFSPNFSKEAENGRNDDDDMKLFKDPTVVNLKLAAMKMSDGYHKCSDEKNTAYR
jgi:hypothetical protein